MRKWILLPLACAVSLAFAGSAQAVSEKRLLAKYQPVTIFDPAEQFRPTSVKSFVVDSNLEAMTAPQTWTVTDADPRPATLPTASPPVWRLNQRDCSAGLGFVALACYADAWDEDDRRAVLYGRVVKRERALVLQYWYFYYYNLYSYAYPPSDALWQAHEGDWEVVNVVLSRRGKPRYVGYSQHCTGERRDWEDVSRWRRTHPIVYVAIGSHANYFEAGTHPFDRECLPQPVLDFFAQAGLPLPVDYAGDGPRSGPKQLGEEITRIRRVGTRSPHWIRFPGFWGELQYFHGPSVGTVPLRTSPLGPAFHAVWRAPLATLATWPEE